MSASLRHAATGSEIGVLSVRTLHREFGSTILTVPKSPKNSSYFVATRKPAVSLPPKAFYVPYVYVPQQATGARFDVLWEG